MGLNQIYQSNTRIGMKNPSSAMADAERDLKHLTEMESKKSRDHRKRRRGHKDRDRSRSCEDSEELRNFRDAINRLESNIDLTVPPPPPLTECLTDSPAQLLSSAWSVVGLADVIQLTPARLLTSCRRQQSRQLGRFRAKTPTEVDLPTGFFSAAEGQEEVRVLWRRCLKELEKMEADEVVAVLEKERDPLTVTWKPNQRDNRLVHVEVQTDAIGNNDSDDYDDATEEPKKSRDGAKTSMKDEVLELELRARAIRALLTKQDERKKKMRNKRTT